MLYCSHGRLYLLTSSPRRPSWQSERPQAWLLRCHKTRTPFARRDLLFIDLQTEIALIRQSMQCFLTLGKPQTYREAVDFLRALSLASTALARLVRTHHYLYPPLGPQDELANDINQALKEVGQMLEAREMPSYRLPRRPHPRPPRRFPKPASAEQS